MTLDERIAFLVQSTESLHATAQERTAQVQAQSSQLEQLTTQVKEHTKQLEIDAENIRRLANIAASHEQRIDDLESDN